MTEIRSRKTTANRIAKKTNTEYNAGKGVDIKSTNATVEVETPETVGGRPGTVTRSPLLNFILNERIFPD